MQSKIAIQSQLKNNNEIYPTSYYKMMKIGAQSNSTPTIG
jgi:ribosomal protein S19E (S16A)